MTAAADSIPTADPIFQPLHFRNLTVKNRIFRSSISGRFDHYDGSGSRARIHWESRFADGGAGAIITSFVPVHASGAILPNYARIDADDKIPFWRTVARELHERDCRLIIQLSHSGRQRDVRSIEHPEASPSSTANAEPLNGLPSRAMTQAEIAEVVQWFAKAAGRAQKAGADGVELHGANGYLFTQFLSSSVNDRQDGYGGPLEQRARFAREVIRAIRAEVGRDFHVQFKISATEYADALFPWVSKGNTVDDSIEVLKWLVEDGIDAVHVSTGASFPHPRNPSGQFPVDEFANTYEVMLRSGTHAPALFYVFTHWPLNRLFRWWWERGRGPDNPEGANLPDAIRIKAAIPVPIITTGGFQTASVVRAAIANNQTDAVSIARPLIANPDLPKIWRSGKDRADRPCTYCNKCLGNVLMNPLGCYDESRFPSREAMVKEILSVYQPREFTEAEIEELGVDEAIT